MLIFIIFIITYAGIAAGGFPYLKINRAGIAVLGAACMFVTGTVNIETAGAMTDASTLVMLFGLMIISSQLRISGFYSLLAHYIIRRAHQPVRLLAGIAFASAALSAIFANDIICLAFTPVLSEALIRAKRNPVPYLLTLAMSSNTGSVATLIGNPQNMYIGQVAGLSFFKYSAAMIPAATLATLIIIPVIYLLYKKEFLMKGEILDTIPENTGNDIAKKRLAGVDSLHPDFIDRQGMFKALFLSTVLLVFFVAGMPRDITALIAASLLFLSRRRSTDELLAHVDWNLILLFLGLFVVTGSLQASEYSSYLNIKEYIQSTQAFLAITVFLSNIVSNVPAVLLLKDVPQNTQDWYMLALASTLAGNLTLTGSIANLIVAEKAKEYKISIKFMEYMKAGIPVTVISLLLSALWIVWSR